MDGALPRRTCSLPGIPNWGFCEVTGFLRLTTGSSPPPPPTGVTVRGWASTAEPCGFIFVGFHCRKIADLGLAAPVA